MALNPYESERSLAEYLLFHYGNAEEVLSYPFGPVDALDFAVRVVTKTVDVKSLPEGARALDLGCAVGRSSFELARWCAEVIGVDFSASFIRAATTLAAGGEIPYENTEEGEWRTYTVARARVGTERQTVRFEVGDACDLRPDLGSFDVVLMANLVDRLPDPRRCLERLPGLVAPGGQLVIASPFTWLEEYTPREHWLGGITQHSQAARGPEALLKILAKDFEFLRQTDLPLLIREHARKYQWSVSWAGTWRRRS